jgi:hypothetical protein
LIEVVITKIIKIDLVASRSQDEDRQLCSTVRSAPRTEPLRPVERVALLGPAQRVLGSCLPAGRPPRAPLKRLAVCNRGR